jgi:CheY-like chemotaxis protein
MGCKKILVVDDSQVVLMKARMILGARYEPVFATDGEEAVEKALEEDPDLILMDVVMPKMDGFEACRAIRANPDTNGIPIIMVTTRGEPVNVEMGYASGCNDYITKPIDGAELLRKLENLLEKTDG